jgi:hypothetical protein
MDIERPSGLDTTENPPEKDGNEQNRDRRDKPGNLIRRTKDREIGIDNGALLTAV